ncbi:hypothetical protein CPC08DRAFT_347308 [Agrocybe pediades]|nr:hypothetical protein CPC08DRAFT_347308 [Agrocybe pediades]
MPLRREFDGKNIHSRRGVRDSTSSYSPVAYPTRPTRSSSSRSRGRRRTRPLKEALLQARNSSVDDTNSTTFTAGSSSTFSKPPFGQPPCFQCIIKDNNPAVHYYGVWNLNGTQISTTHSTTDSNASITLRFNGTKIVVFGVVPESSNNRPPPTAVYSIDESVPFTTTLPLANAAIPNQPLFASPGQLSTAKEHLLIINVTKARTPYAISQFFVFPNPNSFEDMMMMIPPQNSSETFTSTPASSATSKAASTSRHSVSSESSDNTERTIKVLAALLALSTCLLIAACALFFIKHRRSKQKEAASRKILMPMVSCPEAKKARPDTVYTSFTTTESIVRNDDNFWSPAFRSPRSHTLSDGRTRSDSRSRSASDGRRSALDAMPPPLPPKPIILQQPEKPS